MKAKFIYPIPMKKINQLLFSLFFILLVSSHPVQALSAPGMDIVVNARSNTVIVVPVGATLRESFAAEELQKYLKKISGAVLQIKTDADPSTGNVILIGGPGRNKSTKKWITEASFNAFVPGPEGMMIKTFGSNVLILAGSSNGPLEYERGTLYAVYEFLETNLGCSFAAYSKPGTEMGEYIPPMATINIGTIDYAKSSADLSYRTGIVQYNPNIPHNHGLSTSLIDWLAKNRYNRINTMASVYESFKTNGLLFEAKKRGILFTVGHHESSLLFLPPNGNSHFRESYYDTHPEYYRLEANGTRYWARSIWRGQWIFDSRNQNAISQIARNINTWLSENPYVDVVSLWPLDSRSPECTCTDCSKYTKVENYAFFVNEVSKKVKIAHPNVKMDILVYNDLWEYPKDLILDPSMIIEQANSSRPYGKSDGTSLLGSSYEVNAKKWAAGGGSLVYYEYYMGKFGANQVYFPMADELQSIYKYFKSSNYSKGSGTQIESHNLWNFIPNYYIHGRTSYNTSLTLSDNLDKFCKVFGAGAPYVKQYIEYAEKTLEGQGGKLPGDWFIKNVNKATVYDYFEKAYQAEPEGTLRNNIRMLRMAFRYSDLFVNGGADAELKYMYDHFDSYEHNLGYGIAIRGNGKGTFSPDKWYENL
jgi:hypothetical protein